MDATGGSLGVGLDSLLQSFCMLTIISREKVKMYHEAQWKEDPKNARVTCRLLGAHNLLETMSRNDRAHLKTHMVSGKKTHCFDQISTVV